MSDEQRERALGALVGLACGDAVGTTLEFKLPGTFEPIDDMVGGGPFGLIAGQWTDDTSMALCLAESILDRGGMDLVDQMRRYSLWQHDGYLSSNGRCFDIGATTSSQLNRFARTGEPVDPQPDPESAANGSLMRLAAVPIRWHRDLSEAAERSGESSRTTHAAPRPLDTCRLMGAMTAALIDGVGIEEVVSWDFWRWGVLTPEVAAIAGGSWRTKEPPEIRGTGYCVDALEAAIWAVAGAESFREAVLRAANLGDDADTTAAIAGQLAGARWGWAGIPSEWRQRVASVDRIRSLAIELFVAGEPAPADPTPWANDEFLHAWWVEPGRVLAGEYPGHPDPVQASDKVNVLIDAGVRTFIDLTTPDDRLTPYQPLVAAAADARGLVLVHHPFPIPDNGVIADDAYGPIVESIRRESARGAVYVHCWGGVGRTGTVIGYLLGGGIGGNPGIGYDAIIRRLGELRAGTRKVDRSCPESAVQHDLLRRRFGSNVV